MWALFLEAAQANVVLLHNDNKVDSDSDSDSKVISKQQPNS